MDSSDEDLLTLARTGDPAAIEALLLRYQSKVYGFGRRMCRDPEDAKEVLQETLFAMARGVRNFHGASSLSTWLYAIARSFCVKQRRRGRSVTAQAPSPDATPGIPATQVADPGPGPEEHLEHRETETVLARAIARLAPRYREVLVLRDFEGLSAPEVAEVLGITVDTVKSRLHRARLRVREALSPVLGVRQAGSRQEAATNAPRACPDVLVMFSRHLEGEISPELCAEMERHIVHCARCRDACASLQHSLHLCRTASPPQVPEIVQEAVRERLRTLLAQNS